MVMKMALVKQQASTQTCYWGTVSFSHDFYERHLLGSSNKYTSVLAQVSINAEHLAERELRVGKESERRAMVLA